MPARVVGAATGNADFGGAGFEGFETGLGFEQFFFGTHNADFGLHQLLQIAVDGVGGFAPFAIKGLGQLGDGGIDVGLVQGDVTGVALANSPSESPARRPNTSRSPRLLPPRRLAPCRPAPTSPAANRPGRGTFGFRGRP